MSSSSLDIRLLAQEDVPQGAFPGRGGEDLRVWLAPSAHEQAWQHASGSKGVEICGILVGVWRRDAEGPFAEVQHIIPCDSARSAQAEVTFTHEAWGKINQEMDTKYADSRIVGWYHSHPDFGIFLSDRDVFIHQHFFSAPGQIALVIDPIRKLEGIFCWRSGKPTLMTHYWVGSRQLIRPAESPSSSTADRPATAGTSFPGSTGARLGDAGDWRSTLSTLGMVLLGGLVGYLLANWSDARKEQLLQEALAIRFFNARVLRVGLEEQVDHARADLAQLATRLQSVQKEKATDKDQGESWRDIRSSVDSLNTTLGTIQKQYALAPNEQAALMRLLFASQGAADKNRGREKTPRDEPPSRTASPTAPAKAPPGQRTPQKPKASGDPPVSDPPTPVEQETSAADRPDGDQSAP